ncbi:MAG: PA0069 family radical SAM protein [Proteobacteria bacterium]|nr:PA0069 family radical SAM protein [Pseudomonadota bacterium]
MRRSLIGPQHFKGRGTLSNPPGRFDRTQLESVDDGWYVEEAPDSIATTLEPERAREIITTNDSPDIPFEQSINPYRGCEHACPYCVSPETPVLMADGTTRAIGALRVGDAIYGTRREGHYRRYVRTEVRARWDVIRPAYRVTLEDGTALTVGGDHRFLTERGWKYVTGAQNGADRRPHLKIANKLMGTGAFARPVYADTDYRRGYLCGIIRGDGTLGSYRYGTKSQHHFRLALCDLDALKRARSYLEYAYIDTFQRAIAAGSHRPMQAIHSNARDKVARVASLIEWPAADDKAWQAGFLAGLFDAEGSFSDGTVRISNTDPEILARLSDALRSFGFTFRIRTDYAAGRKPCDEVRLLGGLRENLRFVHLTDPAIARKRDIEGIAVESAAHLAVAEVEPLGRALRFVDITTGTGDYVSDGVISHNCYARPSHAYMGLSPGLDFETRIFYKADAAALLEKQLARPGYVCKPITLGANTDPYQPSERRLKVTRSILEVLLRVQHPVTIITKGALVMRDLDLLAQFAQAGLVNVGLSVTSLDADLKRILEPRAAAPLARLRALRELTAAGVPSGVLVAPVIPAINDHEVEAILEACAQAGALWAGYVLLRLPYEIKDLFREWLEAHYPQRAAHVMSLIRDMRGGRDNDPRFGTRMKGTGPYAELLRTRFRIACKRLNLNGSRSAPLDTSRFRPPTPPGAQMALGL